MACTSGRPITNRSRTLLWISMLFVHLAYLVMGGGLSAHYGAVLLASFTLLPEATAFVFKVSQTHRIANYLVYFAFGHSI